MILNRSSSVISARVSNSNTPIQQIIGAGTTSRGTSTQGLPQPVTNVQISVKKSGLNRIVSVSFVQNPNDPYFTTAQLYLRYGIGQSSVVASGVSPITCTVPASSVPGVFRVVSTGNWGTNQFDSSPGTVVSLA